MFPTHGPLKKRSNENFAHHEDAKLSLAPPARHSARLLPQRYSYISEIPKDFRNCASSGVYSKTGAYSKTGVYSKMSGSGATSRSLTKLPDSVTCLNVISTANSTCCPASFTAASADVTSPELQIQAFSASRRRLSSLADLESRSIMPVKKACAVPNILKAVKTFSLSFVVLTK